ncbi:MAG: hypothetical protein ABI378_07445 [Chitinophagaceae bacterium]
MHLDGKFEISYTNREITPWGALALMRVMLLKLDVAKAIGTQPTTCRYFAEICYGKSGRISN